MKLTLAQYFDAVVLAKAAIRILLGALEFCLLSADDLEDVAAEFDSLSVSL